MTESFYSMGGMLGAYVQEEEYVLVIVDHPEYLVIRKVSESGGRGEGVKLIRGQVITGKYRQRVWGHGFQAADDNRQVSAKRLPENHSFPISTCWEPATPLQPPLRRDEGV